MTAPSPRKKTIRTVFQTFIGLCALAPVIVSETGLEVKDIPWGIPLLAVAAGVTRVMAIPKVEAFLEARIPWLASSPPPDE